MISAPSIAAGISAVLAIIASWNQRQHWTFYALKPLTTLLIMGVAAAAEADSAAYQTAVEVGLAFSLAGDVCLMFEGRRWFATGLISFLLAHLAFISAFTLGIAEIEPPWWSYAALAWGAALQTALWSRTGGLRIPVLIYGMVLAVMVIAAASRHAARADASSLCAVLGAGLFLASDSLLSIQQFVRPYPGARALILSTYWLGIWLIAVSV